MASAAATAAVVQQPKIGTHDGTFHADEACAIFMLKSLDQYKHASITRTRDPKLIDTMDVVVDVGGVYDPSRNRFDHHQREFQDTLLPRYHTRLSSAGLVYKHYGRDVIRTLHKSLSESDLEIVYDRVYKNFVEAMDGHDNGVNQYTTDLAPNYVVNTDLPARVSRLNPAWNEPDVKAAELMQRFEKAIALTGSELVDAIHSVVKIWLPARQIVKDALNERKNYHSSGQILVLKQYTVWNSHLSELETECGLSHETKRDGTLYVLFQDTNKSWRIQAVPVASGSFVSRKPLPAEWRGLRDDELSRLVGSDGCVFVHATGFIGGHKTYDGALAMAIKAMDSATPVNVAPTKKQPAASPSPSAAAPAPTAAAAAVGTASPSTAHQDKKQKVSTTL